MPKKTNNNHSFYKNHKYWYGDAKTRKVKRTPVRKVYKNKFGIKPALLTIKQIKEIINDYYDNKDSWKKTVVIKNCEMTAKCIYCKKQYKRDVGFVQGVINGVSHCCSQECYDARYDDRVTAERMRRQILKRRERREK